MKAHWHHCTLGWEMMHHNRSKRPCQPLFVCGMGTLGVKPLPKDAEDVYGCRSAVWGRQRLSTENRYIVSLASSALHFHCESFCGHILKIRPKVPQSQHCIQLFHIYLCRSKAGYHDVLYFPQTGEIAYPPIKTTIQIQLQPFIEQDLCQNCSRWQWTKAVLALSWSW